MESNKNIIIIETKDNTIYTGCDSPLCRIIRAIHSKNDNNHIMAVPNTVASIPLPIHCDTFLSRSL